MDRKLVSFRLPEDLMQDLRERAGVDGIAVTELVCRLLRQGLKTSTDDRVAALEDEIRELRQLQQINFSNVASAAPPAPVYMFPQPVPAREGDGEIKQRMADLEALMKEVITSCASIPKLESLVEEIQTTQVMVCAEKERERQK
ncbi:hypothetical protein JOY44_19845 [Phormidium sp. CLA17]|uniref:hypothetical protein n=1 Tax=Leptolyngbya sp. Cla-17 TaxID=2803751 RepID=UPI001491784F|nr:hypothetical protein [Leptolyngbya sp. Cla-17]MBM0743844.1 hypothetical protein [Leptolyngbya sp. Cla-17]